jgi:hypothetical protein
MNVATHASMAYFVIVIQFSFRTDLFGTLLDLFEQRQEIFSVQVRAIGVASAKG